MIERLSKTLAAAVFALLVLTAPAFAAHAHYGYQGGHYAGGHGSSHKGGHYVNPRTGNHYTHHK
jgi:hypothetical protein